MKSCGSSRPSGIHNALITSVGSSRTQYVWLASTEGS